MGPLGMQAIDNPDQFYHGTPRPLREIFGPRWW
jgi:hypothetical protein